MATQDDLTLQISVKADEINDLQQRLAYTQKTISQVKDAFDSGAIGLDAYAKAAGPLIRQEDTLSESITKGAAALEELGRRRDEAAAKANQLAEAERRAAEAAEAAAADVRDLTDAYALLNSAPDTIARTSSATQNLGQAAEQAVGDTYALGSAFRNTYDVVELEADQAKKKIDLLDMVMEDLGTTSVQSGDQASQSLRKVGNAAKDAKSGATGLSQTMLEFSRGVEDFSTGGFMGVLNNIPRMFEGIGKMVGMTGTQLAGFTGGISLAATGAYVLWKNWDQISGLFETRNPIPEATKALDRYKDALKDTNKQLDEMKELGSLNAEQLQEFTRLTKEQSDLEKKIAAEKKKEKAVQDLLESDSKEDRERKSAFKEATAGRGQRFRDDLIKALTVRGERSVKDELDRLTERTVAFSKRQDITHEQFVQYQSDQFDELDRYRKTMTDPKNVANLADQYIQGLSEGSKQDSDALLKLMNSGTGVLIGGDGFRKAYEEALPEGKKAKAEAKAKAKKEKEEAEEGMSLTHDDLTEKAKRAIASAVKAGDLDEDAKRAFETIRKQGGLLDENDKVQAATPEQQFDHVLAGIEAYLNKMIGDKRLATRGGQDAAASTARSLVSKAFEDVQDAEIKAKKDAAKAKEKEETKEEKFLDKKTKKSVTVQKKEFDKEVDRLAKSPLGMWAEAMIAQHRAAGGAVDEKGQIQGHAQQQLGGRIAQEIRRYNPQMNPALAATMGRALSNKSGTNLQTKLAGMAGSNMSLTEQLISINYQLLNTLNNVDRRARNAQLKVTGLGKAAAQSARSAAQH